MKYSDNELETNRFKADRSVTLPWLPSSVSANPANAELQSSEVCVRVLVSNDDGIGAPGVAHIAASLEGAGHDVLVVAPKAQMSGAGTATGPQNQRGVEVFACEPFEIVGLVKGRAFWVDASPALCVGIACSGAFDFAPDIVVSGINRGRNVGNLILYSGTVGAVLAGTQWGLPGLALSAQSLDATIYYETAAMVAQRLIEPICALGNAIAWNCNIPLRAPDKIEGVTWATPGTTRIIRTAELHESAVHLTFGANDIVTDKSDEGLTNAGYVTLTAIDRGMRPLDDVQRSTIETALGNMYTEGG